MRSSAEARLVRIPRALLHLGLDDLAAHGVPDDARSALRALIADLPLVPGAASSAALVGAPEVTLPCLVVLARHVTQGLRDHNVALMHDSARLQAERLKLVFLPGAELASLLAAGDRRPWREAVVCVAAPTPATSDLFASRDAAGRATFIAVEDDTAVPSHWRVVRLS